MGWIKLHRKFLKWEWYQDSKMVHLFIHLLLSANHEDNNWKGIEIKRGQLLTSYDSLNRQTKISLRSLRTCLNKLKMTGELSIHATNKYSIITICKYNNYQSLLSDNDNQIDKQTDKRTTSKRQTTDKQTDNKQEDKNIKKDNNDKKIIYAEFVKLKKEEYEKLVEQHGEYWTRKMIQTLDNYKGANGKIYKSDYRAILNWVVEKVTNSENYRNYQAKKIREEKQKHIIDLDSAGKEIEKRTGIPLIQKEDG